VGLALAAPVQLPSVASVVVAVAVQLNRQPVLGPAAIDVVAAGLLVRFREREPSLFELGKESALEVAQGDLRIASEDRPQLCGASRGWPPGQGRLRGRGPNAVPHLGLVARASELCRPESRGQVDDGARDGGDGYAAVDGHVLSIEADPPGCDPGNASVAVGADLGGWQPPSHQAEQMHSYEPT